MDKKTSERFFNLRDINPEGVRFRKPIGSSTYAIDFLIISALLLLDEWHWWNDPLCHNNEYG